MAIPYRTAKFKSANSLAIAILGSTAKFNARQYFRLYGSMGKQHNLANLVLISCVYRQTTESNGTRVRSMSTLRILLFAGTKFSEISDLPDFR